MGYTPEEIEYEDARLDLKDAETEYGRAESRLIQARRNYAEAERKHPMFINKRHPGSVGNRYQQEQEH